MKFNLKYQKGGLFLLIIFGGCVLLVGGIIALGIWLSVNEALIALLMIGGLAAILFIAVKTTYRETRIDVESDGIVINKREVRFSEIQYYYLRRETPKIEVMDIGLSSGKEITITGINHGQNGDEIGKFIFVMKERFDASGSHIKLMESKAAVKFERMKRRGKRVIKGIIYFYLLFDVFVIVAYFSGWKNVPIWSVLSGNLILPMLVVYAFGDE